MSISSSTLAKLDWHRLCQHLAGYCQSPQAQQAALGLSPTLEEPAILALWHELTAYQNLLNRGYRPPIGELMPVSAIVQQAQLQALLDGTQLAADASLLATSRAVRSFATDMLPVCPPLQMVKQALHPPAKLEKALNQAVGPDGTILDTASPNLLKLRSKIRHARASIETQLNQILNDAHWEAYLQDRFFTVRNERYVVPIRLDGHGRVRGRVVEPSTSSQSLFVEPHAITALGDTLASLHVEERLEVWHILRGLTAAVAEAASVLTTHAATLVELDLSCAKAAFALAYDGQPITLVHEPGTVDLIGARHPLLEGAVVANDIGLEAQQQVLIISGPNAGGKTVVLKTLGLIVCMARAGLLIPAAPKSRLSLARSLHLELGDGQNLAASLSTFSGHLAGLKAVLDHARPGDLVLLDELAMGTEPQTGAALAEAVLLHLGRRQITTLATSHYASLKTLALHFPFCRNASMAYEPRSMRPAYKLLLDLPGQSYGLELASTIGLPASIIDEARQRLGANPTDAILKDLDKALHATRESEQAAARARLEAEQAKHHWQEQTRLLQTHRHEVLSAFKQSLQSELAALSRRLKEEANEALQTEIKNRLKTLDQQLATTQPPSPAYPRLDATTLHPGQSIYVVPLGSHGVIERLPAGTPTAHSLIDVRIGKRTVRTRLVDLTSPHKG